ncbi:MFS transporter [Allorhizocola rhizosphaerae]|uniref:MFS transporter n=1 Tax=Allorhizocola rhizosphaerae TaxID=1872709 RepID=UPI0013C3353D|nr:MFS transporter [Allorhizocola rhizosphaerae]
MRRLLINRNYARMWFGYSISALGDQIFHTTVLLWIATVLLKDHRLAPVAVAGVVMMVSVATILVGPFAGVLVDRWDKRRTMLATDMFRAVVVGALTLFAFLPPGAVGVTANLAMIYGTILLTSAATQFFRPAWFTLTSDVVPGEADRARAAGIGQRTIATMVIIGPPMAAPLLFAFGYQWALLLNALSFLVSYLAVRGVRPPDTPPSPDAERPGMWPEFKAGLRFLLANRVLVAMLLSAVIVTAGAGSLNTLDVFFVTENLHAPPDFYGFLATAEGVGIVVGSLLTGWLVARLGGIRVFWAGLIATGAIIVVYARQTSLVPAMVILAAVGTTMGAVNASIGPILMGTVPRELMGRVVSAFAPVQQIAGILSSLMVGWLAATVLGGLRLTVGPVTFGRLDAIFTCAGLLFIAGGLASAIALRAPRDGPGRAGQLTGT